MIERSDRSNVLVGTMSRLLSRMLPFPAKPPRNLGFTLLELLTVLVVLGVALAMVVPNLAPFTAGAALRADVATLSGALQLTRQQAILTGGESRLTLDLPTGRWEIAPGQESGQLSGRVAVTATVDAELTGQTQVGVAFMADGSTSGAAFVLKAGDHTRTVRVDWLTGKVTIDD